MAMLFDRYELEVLPTKAAKTQADQRSQLKRLRGVFGGMDPNKLRQPRVVQYRAKRAQTAPTAANREIELLSHICTIAVEWGIMDAHPLKGLRKLKTKSRRRYVTDEEYIHVWNLASPMVRCVLDLALLTGLRRGDIFALDRSCIRDEGLYAHPSKTADTTDVELIFELTPALKRVIRQALLLKPQVRQHIVCNRKGRAFTKNGFDSVWQRLMDKACADGMERWQFRDLRRKSATDTEELADASERLGHSSQEMTKRVYRVKPNKVKPLR